MNKRLLTLTMVGLLSIGLTSCADVRRKKVDGKEIIVTIKGQNYTADDLLKDYSETTAGVNAYYNAIYDVLVDKYQEVDKNMTDEVDKEMDNFVKTVKQNAATNNKTYRKELSNELEEKGLDSLSELRDTYMLSKKKTTYEDNWYADNFEANSKDYFQKKTPYHIKHILVKTDNAGTSLYDGKISETESLKLTNVIERLADGEESFGQIAQQASDDSGSAALYGSVGIMDQDTSFVSPFKLGIFAYDAYFDNHTDAKFTSLANRVTQLNIPAKVLDESTDKDASISGTKSLDVKKAITSIGQVPYQAVLDLEKYADKTTTVDNLVYVPQSSDTAHYNTAYADRVGKTINESYYPRNIIFNNYFNDNGLYVITNTGYTGTSDRFESFPALSDAKILTDGNHNPILVTRGGSGDSYQGIHLMVVEQSPFWYNEDGLKYTSFNTGTIENPTIASDINIEKYLLNYYGTDIPATTNTDVSKDQRYVTFIKTTRSEYTNRSEKIESQVKSYNPNSNYAIYETLVATAKADGATFDATIEAKINKMITNKKAASQKSQDESNLSTWTSYVELLTEQDAEKAVKQLSLDFIKLYDTAYTKTNVSVKTLA